MANYSLLWPEAFREEAVAWVDAFNTWYTANVDPTGPFTAPPFEDEGVMKIAQDINGNWRAAYPGYPYTFNFAPVVEPQWAIDMRPNSWIAETWTPPEE